MQDLVLIFPSLTLDEKYASGKFKGEKNEELPPLGLAGLAAYVRERGFSVGLIEPISMDMNLDDIIEYVEKNDPKVLGFSVLTAVFHKAVEIAKVLKKRFPEKIFIIGGHHATIQPDKIAKNHKVFDVLVYGEAEITLSELLEHFRRYDFRRESLNDFTKLRRIDGILFRERNRIVKTSPRDLIENMDDLPLPARDLLPVKRYLPPPLQYKKLPVVQMMVSRGCPFHCTYCSTHEVFGYKPRFRSPAKVIEEIKEVIEKYGAKEITFWDDNFTLNKEWVMDVCSRMIKENFNIGWTCFGRVNTVDREMLQIMKESGCWEIFYGIESGNQDILNIIKKGITLEQVKKVVKLTQDVGIEVRGLFMLGLPGETPEKAKKTIRFAIDLDLDYAQFSITTPHEGTELASQAKIYGDLNRDLTKYTQMNAVFLPKGYSSRKELLNMQKKAVRKFYFRPRYVLKMLMKLKTMEDVRRYIYGLRLAIAFSR